MTLSDDAYVSGSWQLRAEFSYVTRKSEPRSRHYWSEQVRHQERHCRSILVYTVPYQSFMAYFVSDRNKEDGSVRLRLGGIVVPQGFQFKLASEVSYVGSYLSKIPTLFGEDCSMLRNLSRCLRLYFKKSTIHIVCGLCRRVLFRGYVIFRKLWG